MTINKRLSFFLLTQLILIGIFEIISHLLKIPINFFSVLYMFFPFLGVIITKLHYGIPFDYSVVKIKLSRYYLYAILIPFIITFISICFALIFFKDTKLSLSFSGLSKLGLSGSSTPYTLSQLGLLFLKSIILGSTINAFFALGEETGWRSFLVTELQPSMNKYKMIITIGFIWGLWHIPLILAGSNYPNYPIEGSFLMVIFCMLTNPIYIFLLRSKSIIPGAIFHGMINALSSISIGMIEGQNVLTVGNLGIAGLTGILLFDIVLYFASREKKK